MFDLEKAIDEWREVAAQYVPKDDLEELEAHLRDGVEARVDEGTKPEEAFVLMAHQLGDLKAVGKELVKESGKLPPVPKTRRGRPTVVTVGIAVLVSVLLCFGAECFRAYSSGEYRSWATIELRPESFGASFSIFENEEVGGEVLDKRLDVETERQILMSDKTLYGVVVFANNRILATDRGSSHSSSRRNASTTP